MPRKGKDFVFESFEDRKSTVVVGFFCLVYFFISYLLPESRWIGKILPLWPLPILGGLALLTLLAQAVVWKLFHHFQNHWYRDLMTWILFWCEFGLVFFTVVFVSWPAYFFYRTLTERNS